MRKVIEKKNFLWIFVLGFIFFCQAARPTTDNFVFDTIKEQKQFENWLKEFRCVTCPNQNIADSQAPVAGAMRQEIYRRYKQGESQECIRDYLFSQYGEYVSYRPKVKVQNFPLWIMPFSMLVGGIFLWLKVFSHKKI